MHDTTINISLPKGHELAENKSDAFSSGEFRSKAVATLKQEFDGAYWTLRESNGTDGLELKVAIRTDRLELFRQRITELGFSEDGAKKNDTVDEDLKREI